MSASTNDARSGGRGAGDGGGGRGAGGITEISEFAILLEHGRGGWDRLVPLRPLGDQALRSQYMPNRCGALLWFAPGRTQSEERFTVAGKRLAALRGNRSRARPSPRDALLLPPHLLLQALSAHAPSSVGSIYEGPTASALAKVRLLA